jgi:DNA-binding transcriptional MerR regulator
MAASDPHTGSVGAFLPADAAREPEDPRADDRGRADGHDPARAAGDSGGAPPADSTEVAPAPPGQKSLTIGAVCKALQQEFPDISISKIRYLEDQKLLTPRRTAGGYRLYTTADVARLRAILRLQRDEFLPLRVIRQELAAGRGLPDASAAGGGGVDSRPGAALKRATFSIRDRGASYSLQEVVDETGADPKLIKELEDFGIVSGRVQDGTRHYDDAEREIVRAVTELAQYGVAARNLRVLRMSAEREAALLQQILAPALRSRNPERRKEAVEALENLAAVASHLKHLLLVRDLRKIAG